MCESRDFEKIEKKHERRSDSVCNVGAAYGNSALLLIEHSLRLIGKTNQADYCFAQASSDVLANWFVIECPGHDFFIFQRMRLGTVRVGLRLPENFSALSSLRANPNPQIYLDLT